jgi:hypothetical protein
MRQQLPLLLAFGILLVTACADDAPFVFLGDIAIDTVSDVSTDTVSDTSADTASDVVADAEEDSDPDVIPDGGDVPADGPCQDDDGDGVCNATDACPGSDDTIDSDGDGAPDGCDVCDGFDDSADADGDGVPNGCDTCDVDETGDADGDGVADACDVCPGSNDTLDGDGDLVPDGCDVCDGGDDTADGDVDGVPNECDNCPEDENPLQSDSDGSQEASATRIGYNWRPRPRLLLPLGDDEVAPVSLGFEWDFFGLAIDEIGVSSNGFLTVDLESGPGCCVGGVLGSSGPLAGEAASAPPGTIAGFWEDLNPLDSGGVYYGTVGEVGSREFIVSYEDIAHCCGNDTPPVSFQIVLRESGGAEVQCRECVPHARGVNIATQGVESWRGEVFAAIPGRNSAPWSAIFDGAEFTWSGVAGDGVGDVCDPCPLDSPDDIDGDGICESDE